MANWFVRPDTSHSATRNGTSYSTAWGGWASIVWGAGGVSAGDTLYVCGTHALSAITSVGAHGGGVGTRAVIRGDWYGDPGHIQFVIGGTYLAPRSHTEWRNLSISGVSRCVLMNGSLINHIAKGVRFSGGINPIFLLQSTTGNNHADLVFSSCYFTGGGSTNSPGSAAAFDWFCAEAAALSTVSRVTFDDCEFDSVNPRGDCRGVVGLRSEQDTSLSSIVSDLVFSNNRFKNCRGYALEASDGHSYGAASPQYGLWKGARVFGNTVQDQAVDATGSLGGAFSLFGFDQSVTAGFGPNIVTRNVVDGAAGQAGGVNVCYGTALVELNRFKRLTTTTIDACGVLIDIGAKNCVVRRNLIEDLPGKSGVANSGAAIMILDAENTQVYANEGRNVKCGVFFGAMPSNGVNTVDNNTFTDCIDVGVFLSAAAYRAGTKARNNIFSAKSGSSTVGVSDTAGGWTGENYNVFAGAFSTSGSHVMGPQSKTFSTIADLLVGDTYRLLSGSPLIGAGVNVGSLKDKSGKRFARAPSIGAYEYVHPRQIRV